MLGFTYVVRRRPPYSEKSTLACVYWLPMLRSMATAARPMYEAMQRCGAEASIQSSRLTRLPRKLRDALRPSSLTIVNDSAKHAGHSGNPGGGADAETHFNVEVVSAAFSGLSSVARHRLVYAALAEELEGGVHALTIEAHSPLEVE